MPRYHFNVTDGRDYPDLGGQMLPDLKTARVEAVRRAGELLSQGAETFWAGEEWSMTVTDEHGLTLFMLMFVGTDAPATSSPRR